MNEQMDDLVKSAADKLEALELTLDRLGRIRAVFESPDGTVEATADGHGALVGLWLAESVCRRTPKEVGELVVWAGNQAVEEAGRQRSAIMAELNSQFTA